ncbi:MAG: hypothetical protein D6730_18465 [Bacteroidetes bacterium]|nr:MAG: hypothetical protein D6730_18465 [Bacteroidota bacterium]
MKNLIILISFFSLGLSVVAQHAMFYSFDMSYEQVYEKLNANPKIQILPQSNEGRILAEYDGGTYIYDFHFGRLYQIESRKMYSSKDLALRMYEGSLAYLNRLRPERFYEKSGRTEALHIVGAKGKLFELAYNVQNGMHELVLTSKYIAYAPANEMTKYDYLAANPYDRFVGEMRGRQEQSDKRAFTTFDQLKK